MFEISQLRCFVAVAEELHFGRAAERLNMTQPPLSRQIQLLEHNVGVQLLDRSSRVVRLTAAGHAFLPEALRILRMVDEAGLLARRVARGEQGSLTIGFTSASGYTLLPEVVRRLRERTPELALSLKELVSTAQVEALGAGQLDLGLMRPLALHQELVSLPIATEDMLLAIPAREADSYPLAPTLACLHRRPFIMYSPHEARPFYQMLTSRFERANVAPDVVEHIGQVHTMLALVSAGIGAALVSQSCARLQFDGIVLRRMETEPVHTVCVYRRDNENPILQMFVRDILPGFDGARMARRD